MTPSPRSRKGSVGGESPSPAPSQILFTHEEIVVLKLLFSLFDRGGKVRTCDLMSFVAGCEGAATSMHLYVNFVVNSGLDLHYLDAYVRFCAFALYGRDAMLA